MILAALAILIGSLTASWSENASNSFTERILRRFRSSAECQSASTFMKRTFDNVRLHPLLLADSVSWRVRPGAPRPCWCNGRRARQRRGRRDDGEGPARSAGPPHGTADAGGQRVRPGDRRDAGDLPVAGRAVWPDADRPASEGARAEDHKRRQRCPGRNDARWRKGDVDAQILGRLPSAPAPLDDDLGGDGGARSPFRKPR